MAPRRSDRMGVVLKVAQKHEQDAAGYLTQYQQIVTEQQTQLAQLIEYRASYLDRMTSSQGAMSPVQLSHYSGFIHNLEGMLEQQKDKLEELQAQLEKVRMHWYQQRNRCKSIEELIARLRRGEDKEAERRLQKELDEMAGAARNRPKQ
ncbi:flagellar export protein FliJ [Gilvimarinus sp. SDUM040013]|uniref:Flagellar FliJ protein n=1 Tax=Gilvimarinus gilvus TaxID=3058038 RepID=A0ABU4RXP2_9GAMM|nr:flagellar export protein FliJ [Gilvimarinus sp. SDUM040013]MDO3385058.1 flagellar export protein FliJ [Gilvimarinus sp. SDUM040013]MDX6848433.1 flagellar export protein FliJ [Gilvimarinus sp. SDUM040013]